MANPVDAVLYVNGYQGSGIKAIDLFKKLVDGIGTSCTEEPVPGFNAIVCGLKAHSSSSEPSKFHFVPSYWADKIESLTDSGLTSRLLDGFDTIRYWVFSWRFLELLSRRPSLLIVVSLMLLVFVFWYIGVLALTISKVMEILKDKNWLPDRIGALLESIRNVYWRWLPFLGVSILMAILPANEVVDMAFFGQQYLHYNQKLRTSIVDKVAKDVRLLAESKQPYRHVFVVAHSFGALVAIDALVKVTPNPSRPIYLITVGAGLDFLDARDSTIKKSYTELLESKKIKGWLMINADDDDFLSSTPKITPSAAYSCRKVSLAPTLSEQLGIGNTDPVHIKYFSNPDVEKAIAGFLLQPQPMPTSTCGN